MNLENELSSRGEGGGMLESRKHVSFWELGERERPAGLGLVCLFLQPVLSLIWRAGCRRKVPSLSPRVSETRWLWLERNFAVMEPSERSSFT